ncbi:hypothetical protein [Streptomyces sp. enrichment culture]|uniref:hypothetical protein n=1 Tax=Streptomyces sp. enrichment culture TaxID=1795815 RepID=UPI003F58002B
MHRVRVLLGAALTAGALAVPSTSAHAQTFVPCDAQREQNLKDAIAKAGQSEVGGTVLLAPGCTYTITTPAGGGTGLPVVTRPITVTGIGSVVQRAATAPDFRLFEVAGERGNLALTSVTVRGGRAPDVGGGIWVHDGGRLAVTEGGVEGNSAPQTGGGIENDGGTVVLSATELSGNSAQHGGGLNMRGRTDADAGGTAVLDSLTEVTGNTATGDGGGIRSKGTLSLLGLTTVEDNRAGANGGGIDVRAGAGVTATLEYSSVEDNTAGTTGTGGLGGGIRNAARLTLDHGFVEDNEAIGPDGQGAGIANVAPLLPAPATATLRESGVTGNEATTAPGGIYNTGVVALVSSHVEDNEPANCAGSPVPVPGCVEEDALLDQGV